MRGILLPLSPMSEICVRSDGTVLEAVPGPAAILSGSFNPFHRGHRELAAVSLAKLSAPVAFELSVANVEKAELSEVEGARRVEQFFSGRSKRRVSYFRVRWRSSFSPTSSSPNPTITVR